MSRGETRRDQMRREAGAEADSSKQDNPSEVPTYTYNLRGVFFFPAGGVRTRSPTAWHFQISNRGGRGRMHLSTSVVSININTHQNRFPIDVLHGDVKNFRTAQVTAASRLRGHGTQRLTASVKRRRLPSRDTCRVALFCRPH